MSDVNDLIPAYKRALSVPGGFEELFPSATTEDIVGAIYDALADAQLHGMLRNYVVDPDAGTVTPDLSNAEVLLPAGALVLLFAHYHLLRNEIRNRRNHVKYQAGSALFEEDQTASMLNELLRQAKARIDDLLARNERGELYDGGAIVADIAFIRATSDYGSGIHPLTAWG